MRVAMETGVYNLLKGGTALTALLAAGTASLFYGRPPPSTAAPYVVWKVVSDEPTNETPRDERPLIVDIRGIDTDPETAAQVGDAIETLMKTAIDVTGWDTVHQRMIAAVEMIEDRDGKPIYHDGGRFQLELHQLD